MKWVCAAAAATALLVVGCGGGGGGGDSGTSGGTTPPPATGGPASPSSLVPAAPAVGETLYADASALRPVGDGYTWWYAGTRTDYSGAPVQSYVTQTTQTAGPTAGTARESFSNQDNTNVAFDAQVTAAAAVSSIQDFALTESDPVEALTVAELRSPVRVNDQYTSLQRTETVDDFDGDGKSDTVDVALYSRVVGQEPVPLEGLPAVVAVRVDTFLLARARGSSAGDYGPTVSVTQSQWYAPGVGVVLRRLDAPSAAGGTMRTTTEERLTSFDGITTGLGAMPARAAVVPADSPTLAGATLPSPSFGIPAAFAFGDHALVISDTNGPYTDRLITKFDKRGNVVWTKPLPALSTNARYAQVPGGIVYTDSAEGHERLTVSRLDDQGAPDPAKTVSLDLLGGKLGATYSYLLIAADESNLWLAWRRSWVDVGVGVVYELVLQPFGFDGVPLAAERVLASTRESTQATSPNALTAHGGKAIVTWDGIPATSTTSGNYLVATLSGLATSMTVASSPGSSTQGLLPLLLEGSAALLWNGYDISTQRSRLAGVAINADGTPRYADGSGASPDYLAGTIDAWPSTVIGFTGLQPVSIGNRIVIFTASYDAQSGSGYDNVTAITPDNGPLSLASTSTAHTRQPSYGTAVAAFVAFPDRVLLISQSNGLSTKLVWLPTGNATSR